MLDQRSVATRSEWHAILQALPLGALRTAPLLQSWDWGDFKSRHGWSVERLVWERDEVPVAATQVLRRTERRLGFRASLVYAPRGPLFDWSDAALRSSVLRDLRQVARRAGALFVKIDPELPVGYGVPGAADAHSDALGAGVASWLTAAGWRESGFQIQFRNTVLLDLNRSEDELLAACKQKTRYNIRLAARRGVTIRLGSSADLDLLYELYAETSARDGFVIRPASYYRDAWGSFMQAGLAQALVAEVAGDPVAAVIVFVFGGRAVYMYGMSRAVHREKMPNHLLQWEAIRWSRAQGCAAYDFWGAPDRFDQADPMWGVWRFKAGFQGAVVRTLGAWDYPLNRPGYWSYSVVMPRVLDLMRRQALQGRGVEGNS